MEASWHGGFHDMAVDGAPRLQDGHPVCYSQPGKHAFAPSPEWFTPPERFVEPCRDRPGSMGLHITPLFQGKITREAGDNERVAAYLRDRAFTPSFVFDREFAVGAPDGSVLVLDIARMRERPAGDPVQGHTDE